MPRDEAALLDLPDEVKHLLRPAHGKAGDDHVAAPVEGLLDAPGQGLHKIHPLVGVEPVAVGRFHDQVLCVLHKLGIAQDGLVAVAHVTGEAELVLLTVFREPYLDGS